MVEVGGLKGLKSAKKVSHIIWMASYKHSLFQWIYSETVKLDRWSLEED